MRKSLLLPFALFFALSGNTQTVFFKSPQSFGNKEMATFYASITQHDSLLLFNAPNYKLYAYNKNNGDSLWSYNLDRKSDIPPFIVQNSIWASGNDEVVQLDIATGSLKKTLNVVTLESKPIIKNGILYGTGIYDGGCLFAYDLKADSVIWNKFIAHGITNMPYYLDDKIIANGEANNWFDVDYSGRIIDSSCDTDDRVFPSHLPCVKKFLALTHDGKEINGKLADKINTDFEMPSIVYGAKNTFILNDGKLFVLGDKLKLKREIKLSSLTDSIEFSYTKIEQIIKADSENVWMLYGDYLLVYNFQKKKLLNAYDLKEWQPHQAILDDNKLWLISEIDGLLYGLTLN